MTSIHLPRSSICCPSHPLPPLSPTYLPHPQPLQPSNPMHAQDLAAEGHTVVTSIHQPRSSIFAMFDELVLMSEGRILYCGTAHGALEHFAALGHPCPAEYNPGE